MTKRFFMILACSFLLIFGWFPSAQASDDLDNGAALVVELMDLMREYHLNNPNSAVLTEGAIQGLLDSLEDPYADYFNDAELKGFTDLLNGDLVGVGIEVTPGEEYPLVLNVIPGTPAEKSGIKTGDIIMAVDGQSISGWSLDEAVSKIRGIAGTKVKLTLKRGKDVFEVSPIRADIHVPSVSQEMLPGKTGYIHLAAFSSTSSQEFNKALHSLRDAGMESLILDMRNNGGGYLDGAVEIMGNFVPEGTLAVSTVDGQGHREEFRTQKRTNADAVPMVVIVNEYSASASELLAGALQDYEIATLVGDITYGKGLVQTILPLDSGGALKITVAKYLTPAGHDIDQAGLTPEHYVLTEELQKEVAWQILHPEDVPDLTLELGIGRAVLNGRVLKNTLAVEERGNEYALPLRPTLEAMLYQILWQDGVIKVFSGQQEVWRNRPLAEQDSSRQDVFLHGGVSYLSENILKQLNIDIVKEENKITLTRKK